MRIWPALAGRRKMLWKLLLLVFSSAFAAASLLLVVELRMRYRMEAWPFDPPVYLPDYLTARDATLRWRFDSSFGRNSLGLKNRELEPKKAGTFRILFLGDSLIWSGETSSGELQTVVLERRLNARSSLATTGAVEVVNAGIPGYTTYQELEFLKLYGLDMKPDLVILGFVFNDVYDKYLHRPRSGQKLLGLDPAARRYRFDPDGFLGMLFGWSYAAHDFVFKSEQLLKRVRNRPTFRFERAGDFYLAWKDYGWRQSRKRIGEMKTLLAEAGVPLELLIFPVSEQVTDRYRNLDEAYVLYPQRMIQKICDDYDLRRLDLTDALYRAGGATLYRDYLHLNGKGNDVVTDELEKFITSR